MTPGTTIRMIVGQDRPTSGSVTVPCDGGDPWCSAERVDEVIEIAGLTSVARRRAGCVRHATAEGKTVLLSSHLMSKA